MESKKMKTSKNTTETAIVILVCITLILSGISFYSITQTNKNILKKDEILFDSLDEISERLETIASIVGAETEPEPEPETDNKAPVVISAGYSRFAEVGEAVTFSAKGSVDPDGEIVEYVWYFGDGTTSVGQTSQHSYDLPGYYIIYVEAEDNENAKGNSITTPIFLKVERPEIEILTLDLPPVAIIGSSESVINLGDSLEVDGASSYHYYYYARNDEIRTDANLVVDWQWNMGDGKTYEVETATHTYTDPGSYLVTLTVMDDTVCKEDTVGRTVIVTEEDVSYEGIVKNPELLVMGMGAPSRLELMELAEGNVGRWVDLALSDTLLKFIPGGTEPTTEGGLAKSYEISADGTKYTFTLRKGITFWDGTELKAEDAVYTFRRSMKMSVGRSWGALLVKALLGIDFGEPIPDSSLEEHIYATDEDTIVFELPDVYGPFLFSVAYPGRGIIQKKAAIEEGAWYMGDTRDWAQVKDPIFDDIDLILSGKGFIATGPYKVTEWSKGERILLERYDDYWLGAAPEKTVLSLNIPEWSTQYLMFRQGDIDLIKPNSPSQAEQLITLPKSDQIYVTAIKFQGFIEICYFGFNFDETKAPADNQVPSDFFNDVHMRKAFAYSIPYETYVNEVYLGWAEPAKGVLNPGWPGYYETFPYEYDPVKAEEEFKLAHGGKYWDEGFTVTYAYQAWAADTGGVLGELMAESVRQINPKFKVVPVVTTWSNLIGGGTPIGTMVAENGPDPYYITNVFSGTYGYAGDFGYVNTEVDDLLVTAQSTADPETQNTLYIEAQKIIEQDIPGIHTVYTPTFFAAKNYISGFQYSIAWITDPGWIYTLEKTP